MNTRRLFLAALILSTLAGCSATKFESTWADPDSSYVLAGQKVAAFYVVEQQELRRQIELALAREISARGGRGIAGHTLVSEEDPDEELVRSRLRSDGVVAAIVLRQLNEEVRVGSDGTWHGDLVGRRWGEDWSLDARPPGPGTPSVENVVRMETSVYDLASQKLVWAAVSESKAPRAIDSWVGELAESIGRAMAKSEVLRLP